MTISPITRHGTIRSSHPVRGDFAGCSTGSLVGSDRTDYYSTKGHAVNAFDARLQTYDLCLDRDDLADFTGDHGHKTIAVHDEHHNCVGYAVIFWHRMENSGHYEFTGYLT